MTTGGRCEQKPSSWESSCSHSDQKCNWDGLILWEPAQENQKGSGAFYTSDFDFISFYFSVFLPVLVCSNLLFRVFVSTSVVCVSAWKLGYSPVQTPMELTVTGPHSVCFLLYLCTVEKHIPNLRVVCKLVRFQVRNRTNIFRLYIGP